MFNIECTYINKIKQKILPYVGILSRIGYYIPLKFVKLIYFNFVYSQLQYLASVWATVCNCRLNHLKVMPNEVVEFMYSLTYLETTINTPRKLLIT